MFKIKKFGTGGGEFFLLTSGGEGALFDTGFSFPSDKIVPEIKEALNGATLKYIVLSHSHYDHAGGSPYYKRAFPDAKILASPTAKHIFTKEGALRVIKEMNDNAAALFGVTEYEDLTPNLSVDETVTEGDTFTVGRLTFKVIETPGHTRCSLSFFSEEASLLVAAETIGVWGNDSLVVPCPLVSYEDTISSIEKCERFNPRNILFPHTDLITGEDARNFFKNSLMWHRKTKEMLKKEQELGSSTEEMVNLLRKYFYTKEMAARQPEKAFALNAGYIIKCMLTEKDY